MICDLAKTLRALGSSAGDPRALRDDGAPVLDVRSRAEWDEGHLDGATLIPLPELAARIDDVRALLGGDLARPLVVVCRAGGRAEQARAALLQCGFKHVVNGGSWTALR